MAIAIALGLLGALVVWFAFRVVVLAGRARGDVRGRRAGLWLALLCAALLAFGAVLSVVQVYYRPPAGWLVALAGCGAAIVWLLVLVGRAVGWRPRPVLAALGGVLGALLIVTFVLMLVPLAPTGLLLARAEQIGEANGFTALEAPGEDLVRDYLSVNRLAEPDAGLAMEYEGFLLQERLAPGEMDVADLRALVAPGQDPGGTGGARIPDDAVVTEQEVSGDPAVAVEYRAPEPGGKTEEHVTALVLERDGVLVLLRSVSYLAGRGDVVVPPVDIPGLVQIAETLRPIAA